MYLSRFFVCDQCPMFRMCDYIFFTYIDLLGIANLLVQGGNTQNPPTHSIPFRNNQEISNKLEWCLLIKITLKLSSRVRYHS